MRKGRIALPSAAATECVLNMLVAPKAAAAARKLRRVTTANLRTRLLCFLTLISENLSQYRSQQSSHRKRGNDPSACTTPEWK
jgi:hypothetical protein